MDILRDRRGFSAAEGCMFAAVGLFVALLIALLVLAVLRARNPPDPLGPPRPPPGQVGLAIPAGPLTPWSPLPRGERAAGGLGAADRRAAGAEARTSEARHA